MTAVVIGGGISGIACATELARSGADVVVRDKGHVIGGRMMSRTLRDTGTAFDGRAVDIGASYFTASDPAFRAEIDRLIAGGVVRPWTDAFHVAGPNGIEAVSSGPMRYAATQGLRSVVMALAAQAPSLAIMTNSPVASVSVRGADVLVDEVSVQAAAVCMPRPQAARILDLTDVPVIPWEPVLSVTCVFARREWIELDGVFVNDDSVLTWIADDGSRRGDGAPVLVAHVHPVLSARHLDDPSAVLPSVIAALQRVLAISGLPEWAQVHRWSLAKPLAGHPEPFWRHGTSLLGLAGDEWHGGPRVEAAWLSGHSLGTALAVDLSSG